MSGFPRLLSGIKILINKCLINFKNTLLSSDHEPKLFNQLFLQKKLQHPRRGRQPSLGDLIYNRYKFFSYNTQVDAGFNIFSLTAEGIPESKKNDNKIINFVSKRNNIEDLVNMAIKKQEIELKKDLESNVSIVDFKQGKINIEFNSNLSKNFPKLLTNKLFEWTGKKWVISFTNDKNEKLSKKEKNLEDIKGSEVYTSVMESFPDAKFLDKQNINEDD